MLKSQLFNRKLLSWHRKHNVRKLPWKGISNPYKIWLSEIILQQTRAEQGLPYYLKITQAFPTITDLANADEQIVFKLWQGLGYYSRCRNMLHTAKYIQENLGGVFPESYDDIRALKGVGDYTAAAIASFAFKLPYAVVDGNVVRVLSRVFALRDDFYTSTGKKKFQELAQQLIAKNKPDLYNQAIMDLGATICKPLNPLCDHCPLQAICEAYQRNHIALYPVKKKKIISRERHFHFFLPHDQHSLYVSQRNKKDIWQSLYTPIMIENTDENLPTEIETLFKSTPAWVEKRQQQLTHQKVIGYFYFFNPKSIRSSAAKTYIRISKEEIYRYGFPQLIISFFEKYNYL